jgi:exosortase
VGRVGAADVGGKVTAVVFFAFDMLGLPLERHGNVLVLPRGEVGVAEACSGIRSLTGSIFAGSFLAAVFLDRFWKKIALVVAAMVLAFFTNIVRSLFLTGWAYAYGSEAIEGTVHDVTGYAVLGLTCLGLLALIPLFNFRFEADDAGTAVVEDEPRSPEPAKSSQR